MQQSVSQRLTQVMARAFVASNGGFLGSRELRQWPGCNSREALEVITQARRRLEEPGAHWSFYATPVSTLSSPADHTAEAAVPGLLPVSNDPSAVRTEDNQQAEDESAGSPAGTVGHHRPAGE